MKIARVNNITETIKMLKENGVWILGTDMQTDTYYYNQNFKDCNCNWKRRFWN